jgi:hypothetical protein
MSDGFPSHACAGVILSRGGDVAVVGRLLVFPLVSDRGHTTCEFRTRVYRVLEALWIVMRVELSMVVPRSDGERSGQPRQ